MFLGTLLSSVSEAADSLLGKAYGQALDKLTVILLFTLPEPWALRSPLAGLCSDSLNSVPMPWPDWPCVGVRGSENSLAGP